MPNTTYRTSPEVAAVAGCSIRTVHRAVQMGELVPALKLPGPNGAFLFTEDVVENYRASRNNSAA